MICFSKNVFETFTSVDIFFENFQVEEVTKFAAYNFSNFIADCGGLLGLFLGCSVLSIVELFYLLVMFVCKRKDKNLKKKKMTEISMKNNEIFIIKEFRKRDVENPFKV
jgi:uncharacterized membrane protein